MAATPEVAPVDDRREVSGARRSPGAVVAIGLVALVGFVWRVAYTLWQFAGDDDLTNEGDAFVYGPTALNTAAGHWFENPFNGAHFADHPPMTVLALTPTGWLFPESLMAQRITHCVFGAVAIVLIGLVARTLAGDTAGIVAAVVAAANPNLWMNDAVIMSESISTVLIAALIWAAIALRRRPTWRRAAATGALCGLTILARAEIGLFLPFLLAPALLLGPPGEARPAWADRRAWLERVAKVGLVGVCAVAVIAPWTAWNSAEFAEPVLISTNDGTTLLGANCPPVYDTHLTGAWYIQCVVEFNDAERTEERGLDASQVSSLQREAAVDHIRTHAGRLPKVVVARLGRTFGWWRVDQQVYINQGEGRPEWASWLGYGTFWALIVPSAAGARVLRRRGEDLLPAAAALATVVAVSVLFYGIARFRLPLDVMMSVLTGVAGAALLERWRTRRRLSAPPTPGEGAAAPSPPAP